VKLVMFAEHGRDVVAPGILRPDGVVTLATGPRTRTADGDAGFEAAD
jgi:hypothetical protein